MSMSNFSFSIDKVFRWPISIVIEIPESEVIIQNDWIGYICCGDCLFYITLNFLESEFRSMDSDDNESLVSIFAIPGSEIWESALTVDTRVCPKIDDDNFSLQARHREWIRVDPVRE